MEEENSDKTGVEQAGKKFGRVDIEDLLNPQDEDDVLGDVTDEQLALSTFGDIFPA